MSIFKSLLTSTSMAVLSVVGFVMPVLGGRPANPVGGVVTAVNKLAIIAPYLVMAGIVAVASAIYVVKKRKD